MLIMLVVEQKEMSEIDRRPIMKLPAIPLVRPASVTPPFVPGGTTRQGAVISLGWDLERMPSSDERVSAVTAA